MSFTETIRLKLYWNTTYTTEPDGTITVQRDAPDGYLIIDRMLDFSELVDKVLSVIGVDRERLYIDFSLVWTERSGKRSRVHINDDNTIRFIYLCADKWPELYHEKVERTGHVYASTSGQDIGASTSGGRTVEDNEDGDEDGDEDEDKDEDADEDEDVGGVKSSDDEYVPSDEDSDDDTDFESSSSVPYVFDDISGWDKTLEEVENDGIKMWDGNPLTLGLDIHFANKPEAQAAVGEWNLVHGRTFRVKTSSKRTWYVECKTCGPKYPKERLHGYDCLWKARVSLQKATDTWKMVVWSDSHNCLGANKRNESRNVTSSMIARLVAQNVRKHPDFAVAQIQIEVMKRYQVECSYKKAWHGRRKALEALYGTWESNFQQLPSFLDALFMSNPNTCVQFKFKENSGSSQRPTKQVVLYANRECTCGRWQTFRFPCSHALRVARELGDDPFPLFDPCYTTHQWYQQFSGEFNPIMEPWPKATWQIRPDDTKLVHHAGRGRKRVNRKKGVMDYTSKSGQRRLQTCSLCKLQGHNARACPYARVCARCGSLDHDAVECPFSHPPADRTGIDKLYDPYGIYAMDIGSSSSSQSTSKKLRRGPETVVCCFSKTPIAYLERMFGFRFQTEESRLTSVSITEIKTHIENNPLTDLSPDDAHLQRARCFVGWLVGGLLFSNTTRNSFPLDLVHFLHTPEICSEYSWGSAALCYLYRSMSKSSLAASAKAITGCVILLQLWAWERILTVQPKILGGDLDLSDCPLGTRWSREKKVQGITRFNLAAYRDQLAVLAESDFVWMPYTTLLGRIARVCLVGQGIWRSQTWLICGDVVAPHNPSRVFRQFGYHQRIPGDALLLTAAEITSLLKRKPFGGSDRRWLQQLGIYLQGEDEAEDEDEDEDADQDDQFEGQGYQRHEEQGSSQILGTPPLAVSKGQRVMKEPDRLTYSLFRAKKPKKK
ncbi:OLC1v1000842C1 [Oldenlandia corymbosa var. corymbosa]|uniref:OLC1v1000842C1 n=1 Tax=Oldenlandia corymbosa var. corymbosa TaxID=529605 RepID=A0AAV1D6M4_OLDCO|nr:OLC1v1000842C1 [Oldenlandia corymbosa var. corymbosa]